MCCSLHVGLNFDGLLEYFFEHQIKLVFSVIVVFPASSHDMSQMKVQQQQALAAKSISEECYSFQAALKVRGPHVRFPCTTALTSIFYFPASSHDMSQMKVQLQQALASKSISEEMCCSLQVCL